jgi:DNA-binding LacI/PurR family transcriptional regulator
LIAAIRDECLPKKYALHIMEIPAESEENFDIDAAMECSGVILVSPIDISLLHRLQQNHTPYILLQNDIADGGSHCVCCNYARGIMDATLHLLRHRCEDVALITAEPKRYSADQMRIGFELAHAALGKSPNPSRVLEADYSIEQAYRIVNEWLEKDDLPDGAIFPTETMASAAMMLLHQAGVQVGNDIVIVGFGKPLDTQPVPVPFTIVNAHNERIGKAAMKMLQDLMDHKQLRQRRMLIDPELIPAES